MLQIKSLFQLSNSLKSKLKIMSWKKQQLFMNRLFGQPNRLLPSHVNDTTPNFNFQVRGHVLPRVKRWYGMVPFKQLIL